MKTEINHFNAILKASHIQRGIYDSIGYDPRVTYAIDRVEKAVNPVLENISIADSISGKFIISEADNTEIPYYKKSNIINGLDLIRWCFAADSFKRVAGAIEVTEFGNLNVQNVADIDTDNILVHEGNKYRIYFQKA